MTFGRWLYNNFTGIVYCGHCNVCKHIRNIHTPGEPETLLYDLMLSFGVCFFSIRLSFTEVRTTQSLYLNWGKLHYKQHTTANSLLSLRAQIHSNTFGYFNNNVKSNLYICRSELSVCHNVALNTNY